MNDIATALTRHVSDAFDALGLDRKWGAVRRSDRPDLADFQCNGAMGAAKAAGQNPRALAETLTAALAESPLVAEVTVAGPGFLNIKVAGEVLNRRAEEIAGSDRAGVALRETPSKVVIDFGGPNVAKPMHVGHLRSAVIGDTLQRLCRFVGDEVVSDAHLGDWGLQMGHLITELEDEQPGLVYFDEAAEAPFPAESPVTIEDLARLYPQASKKAKADPSRNERSQAAVADLQRGRPGYRALLRHFIDVSVAALKVDYAFLNVHFDLWKGEADAEPFIGPMVEDLKGRGIALEDDGAWIVPVARDDENVPFVDKKGEARLKNPMPPFMLVNSRGGTGYHATDLATIVDRARNDKPDRILYVVDQRQAQHFEQVFRASEIAGYFPKAQLEHLGFGTVNGPDGTPFKTKEGGTVRLAELNRMALEEAEKKLATTQLSEDIDAVERAGIARNVALAAIRFADLQNVRTTNYIFDLDRFTSFEGKTGPYLLYAVVRIKSLLRRASEVGHSPGAVRVESATERALALELDGFEAAVHSAYEKRVPHFLCEHLYRVAQAFSAVYGAHPIAAEEDDAVRASRLGLCEAVRNQLETGLGLIGIDAPDRM